MSETSIKVSIDLVDKAAQKALEQYISKSDKADKGHGKLGKSGSDAFTQIGVSIGNTLGIYDIFVGNLLANLATKAFDQLTSAASKMFNTFVVEGVKAAQAQEEANHSLNIALAQTGIYSAETALEMQKFAESLQATTGIADDVITQNAALIQNLGALDKDGLKRATQAAVDLSSALGVDLTTASQLVGKAAAGEVGTLSRYGLIIEKAGTKAETFARALDLIESRFGGTAAQKVNTFGGAVSLVSATFADLQEEIGNVIIQNNVLISLFQTAGRVMAEMTEGVKDQNQVLKETFGGAILLTIQATNVVVVFADTIMRAFTSMFNTVASVFHGVNSIFFGLLSAVDKRFESTFNHVVRKADEAAKGMAGAFREDTALGDVSTILFRMEEAARKGFDQLKQGASTSVEPVNSVKNAVVELTEEQKKQQKALEDWIFKLAEVNTTAKGIYDTQLADLQARRELELIGDQEFNSEKLRITEEYFAAEQAKIEEYRLQKNADQLKADQAEVQLAKNKQLALQKQEKITNDQRLKSQQAFSQAGVNIIAASSNLIAALTAQGSREAFYAAKAAALAQAIVSTNLAAAQALAVPPAPNFALAGLAKVAGGINIAAILATAIQGPSKFAQGGIVPGSSFSGDRVPALVNSGEMVLNRSQQSELFKLANGRTSSSESRIEQLINMVGTLLSQPISIQIEGREIINVTRSELASGRSVA